MKKLAFELFILSCLIPLAGCNDLEEVDSFQMKKGKYVMSVDVTGGQYVGSRKIGSIENVIDTIIAVMASEESIAFFGVPDTLTLLANQMAEIRYSKHRYNFEELNEYFSSADFKYTETSRSLIIADGSVEFGFIFSKESGHLIIEGELINLYKSNGTYTLKMSVSSLHGTYYGPGNWPEPVGDTDTVNYYNLRFGYN